MLEVTNSQRAGPEWPPAARRVRGRRESKVAYRSGNAARNGPDMSPYAFLGESLPRGSDHSRSPLSQSFNPQFLSYFTDHQLFNNNPDSSPVSYQNGVDLSPFSSSPIANTLASNSPSSPQMYGGSHLQPPMESFSPSSNDEPEIQWATPRTCNIGSDIDDMAMSDLQLGSFGTLESLMMPSPNIVSAPMSEGYADVNSTFANSDDQHQLDDLALSTNSFFPVGAQISPSSSFSISPTSPIRPEDFHFDPNYAPIPDGFDGLPMTVEGWSAVTDQRFQFSERSLDTIPQGPWNSQQVYVNGYQSNTYTAGFTPHLQRDHSSSYNTNDISQSLLKPEPHLLGPEPPSPGGKSDSSWALISHTSSDAPSFGSPYSQRSPDMHAVSPSQLSHHDFDHPHSHVIKFDKFENNSKIVKTKIPRGRQRGLTAVEKKQARDVRDAKACWACHISKTKCSPCSPGKPCEQCARLDGKRRFCNFSCFNDPLEALHKFMVPDYLMGHFTRHNVESFVAGNTSGWGTELMRVKLWWGHGKHLEADVVSLSLRSGSIGMRFQHQITQNGYPRPTLVRKQSPPLGIPFRAMDEIQDTYTRYIQDIVANELEEYVPVAYTDQDSMLAEQLLGAVSQFYCSESTSDSQSDLLRRALEIHVTVVILERSLVLDQDSLRKVKHHLQEDFPESSAPKCAQRQIKLAIFEPHQRRILRVLKDWGNMMWATNASVGKDKDWAVSFSVFLVLVLVMDKMLGAAYYFCEDRIKFGGEDARAEKAQFDELVKLTQTELFERCKEIFHWKFKTRKGGKEACNPIRDGVRPFLVKSNSVDGNVQNLVRDLQNVVEDFEQEIKLPMMKKEGMDSEYMNAGRLASIFLNDFVNR